MANIYGRAENLLKFSEHILLDYFLDKQRAMEEVREAFKYHFERKELYDRVMALSARVMKPKEIYRELNGDNRLPTKTKQKVKISYVTIYHWVKGRYKPILCQ